MQDKSITIEYLYLDLQSCDRCIGTDIVLEEVISELTPVLEQSGYSIEYHKIEMKTVEIAAEYRFLSSPTIRVNGQDICTSVTENNCGCCSDISGHDVDCRVFVYDGVSYEVPPKEMLTKNILQTIYASPQVPKTGSYAIPDNLQKFYTGKTKKATCFYDRDCCQSK